MKYTATYSMTPQGIGESLAFIEETLKAYRMGQRDLMEALLISEETILQLEEHATENAEITIEITKWLKVPRIRLMAPGTPMKLDEHVGTTAIDQLGSSSEMEIRSIMLRSYSDSIKYRNNRAGNVVTITTGIPERVLSVYTVTAILLAIFTGIILRLTLSQETITWLVNNVFSQVENLFISALMCITAPAVFVSITCSMFRFEGFSELGSRGKKVVACYIIGSIMATLVGLGCFNIFKPGDLGVLSMHTTAVNTESLSVIEILSSLIPPNIIEPFISVNSIQLTIAAITIGAALASSGNRVYHIKVLMEELDTLCGKVASIVMRTVPVVVYFSTSSVILNSQTEYFGYIAELIITIVTALGALFLLYCVVLFAAARLNPFTLLKKYWPTMKSTFLKGSGVAAIPMTMRICRRRLGIPNDLCSFSIPLGATINMNGNSICLIICSLYFAYMCGIILNGNEIIILLILVLILSLGAPIAPGTLILCLVTLMKQMSIDLKVLSLIIGLNFILEMVLGMINTIGDVVVALIVAKQEGSLDIETYNKL